MKISIGEKAKLDHWKNTPRLSIDGKQVLKGMIIRYQARQRASQLAVRSCVNFLEIKDKISKSYRIRNIAM